MLRAPPWVLIDEVLDSLDEAARQLVNAIFDKDLEHSAVIHIGRPAPNDRLFARVLHLIKDPALRELGALAAKQPLTA